MTAHAELLSRSRLDAVPIGDIDLGDRHREDLGDIDALAASIIDVGLLQPVVVTEDYRLVAGRRRVAALQSLGEAEVPAYIVSNLQDGAALLRAERDENTCRKDMTPSELQALGRAIEALHQPEADARRRNAGVGNLPTVSGARSRATHEPRSKDWKREVVGNAVGLSGANYQRAKYVVDIAEKGETPQGHQVSAPVRELARNAQSEMDATGKIFPAYEKVSAAVRDEREPAGVQSPPRAPKRPNRPVEHRAEQIRSLAEEGHRAAQIADRIGIRESRVRLLARESGITLPDAAIGRVRHIDPNRVVAETVATAEGLALGVGLIQGEMDHIDRTQVEEWATSLSTSLAPLKKLAKDLKEMAS